MFERLEQFKHFLQSTDHLFQQISSFWNQGPKVEVFEQGNKAKVVIEAPGLIKNRHQWAVRVLDQNLYLRGQLEMEESAVSDYGRVYSKRRSENFTKIIPLPFPVHQKYSSIYYKDGLVTIVFEKRIEPDNEEWHVLDFSKKK